MTKAAEALRGLVARGLDPWLVLPALLVVHWFALALFVGSVRHNGWLFYQGGDQVWYWTTGWLLGHGQITEPLVSHGWALVLMPFTAALGPGFVAGLPPTLLFQVLVLTPIALWCVYEIGARIGGRITGYVAAALWTLGPYIAVPLLEQRYHEKYVEQFLPHPLGLTMMPDYVGTVALLAAGTFGLRAFQERDPRAAVLAGLTAGFAGVVKPSNLIFIPAVAVVLLAWGRWREALVFGASLAPALGALTLWKYQGFGYVPAFRAYRETRLAVGHDTLTDVYDKYVDIDWHHLDLNLAGLGEIFWSLRVLEFLPFAGAIAVARRSPPAAVLLSIWFWAFFIVKGSAHVATIDSGSFFRFLLPAVPPLLLMVAALPLLVPRGGPWLAERLPRPKARPVPWPTAAVAAVLLGLVPLVAAAVVDPLKGPRRSVQVRGIAVPVDPGLDLRARVEGRTVRLAWDEVPPAGGEVFYKLLRNRGGNDTDCEVKPGGADECFATVEEVRALRRTAAVHRPGPGTWTYRIGVGANYLDDPMLGDVYLVSRSVTVRVR